MRDPKPNQSKRFGFLKYFCFEQFDAAIAAMNVQYDCNIPVTVQYGFKKDSEKRERHGSQAERILSAIGAEDRRAADQEKQVPSNTLFSHKPPSRFHAPHPIPPHKKPTYPRNAHIPMYQLLSYDYPLQPRIPNWLGVVASLQYSKSLRCTVLSLECYLPPNTVVGVGSPNVVDQILRIPRSRAFLFVWMPCRLLVLVGVRTYLVLYFLQAVLV
eukprot:gb/GEZJ01000991.1/.p1 GENE.gb/GEZJ01000991.1/~~gb/GEZJ01000991.1/.p1  ORF type:complete len:214 (+),score=14.44 gb/GEZJ01000991.1/:626-1267(+)